MLYDGLNVSEALSGKSKCRNRAIAEAFQYMKIIEGWGTGLPRLFHQCKEMGLPEPKFEEFGDGIKVTVYRAKDIRLTNTETNTETSTETNTEHRAQSETDTEKEILGLITQNNTITIKEMSAASGLSVSGVRYVLKNLRERGSLEREGSQKRGRWIVTKRE